ncbi:hypothetical protein [Actinoplanes auranticolor]|uniref:Dolichyl-phosphate-mannose-protein mannosyltransferase n=1 Tax=Actinoplanes auranticolor TaxID=47988 RepID=A0A919VNZ9_9ACTN|nr:hypothetical protein [Actinoplanes auranticolor]GIM73284.1 hypothetical protein Aau02nite_55270 [Actinoplanes auranticolor]
METAFTDRAAARPPASRAGRRRTETAWLLLVVVLATLLFLTRYEDPRRVASGDSFWYMRQALIFTGVDPEEARLRAGEQVCRDQNRAARAKNQRAGCRTYTTAGFSPRYAAIFHSRPGYPLFAAPFVVTLGLWPGMMAATLILALLAAVLAYLAVWLASGLRLAGVLAAAALFVLPTGFAMTRMLTESGVFAGYLAVLLGATLLVRGRRSGLIIIVVALAWLFTVRSASGMAMALTLFAAGLLSALGRQHRRTGLVTGAVGMLAVLVWQVISRVLHLPGLYETIQDFATSHFKARPDVADPIGWLIERNLGFWPDRLALELAQPVTFAAFLFAGTVLVLRMRAVAALWIFTGLTGVMMLLAHPAGTEYDRLMAPIWLPVAAALGYAAALAVSRRPEPPVVPEPVGTPAALIPRRREPEPVTAGG